MPCSPPSCLFLAASCTGVRERGATAPHADPGELEHGAPGRTRRFGCRPRTESDYAAMRAYVDTLGADVSHSRKWNRRPRRNACSTRRATPWRSRARVGTGRRARCGGRAGLTVNAQRTGFAIRKGVAYQRLADVTALQVGNPDLRSGVDLVVRPAGGAPIRVLSGAPSRPAAPPATATRPAGAAAAGAGAGALDRPARRRGLRFAVLGDYNRRLSVPGDDGVGRPRRRPAGQRRPRARLRRPGARRCNPRLPDFIDYIVLDRRAADDLVGFEESRYPGESLSDHCAIAARLTLR